MEFNATIIVAIISFIVFVCVMNWVLYTPIYNIVQKRKDFIDANYNEANSNSLESSKLIQQREDKIKEASKLSREKINAIRQEANSKKDELTQEAKNEAREEFQKRKKELDEQKEATKENLKTHIINLAQLISDKYISSEEKINSVDNELIEKTMQG